MRILPIDPGTAGSEADAWLADGESLVLSHSAIRIRTMRLTQLEHAEHLRAVACHEFVRSLKTDIRKRQPCAAPDVLASCRGTPVEKSNLLIALLRSCGIPSRLRIYLRDDGRLHPVVEARVALRWIATDRHHTEGGTSWDGQSNAIASCATARDCGVFHGSHELKALLAARTRQPGSEPGAIRSWLASWTSRATNARA
jgi:hypothetical protein